MTELLFAKYAPKNLEPVNSIGAKWPRLLAALKLPALVKERRVCIKMHLGGGAGFTTIHPYLTRKLVESVRAAGARTVCVADTPGAVLSAVERGYTSETIGCPIVPVTGLADKYAYARQIEPPFNSLREIEIGGEVADAEVLIDFSHTKGHGACGYAGASKNLSMGCVTQRTRGRIHALEGGLTWNAQRCTRCRACEENCPDKAIEFDKEGNFDVFYHHCKYCQHCVLICPAKALTMEGGKYRDFQRGMALTTRAVLACFPPERRLFINVLTDITIFCDCWGMTTPSLVPDIGILAGRDIVAIEQATLDLIRHEDLIRGALPPGWKLGRRGHLFERVHGKDPYAVVEFLAEYGLGSRKYRLREIE
ncbi:MAG: DUF362 domain-containing protein [Kiritimatiellae bacterium]|nr:DUF362 domain-containing protein [Kiritimatiellia bacterium]